MKVEVEKQKAFTPVKITLTIESEEEFCDLFHRVNAPCGILKEKDILKYKANRHGTDALFKTLDDLLNNEYQYLKTK